MIWFERLKRVLVEAGKWFGNVRVKGTVYCIEATVFDMVCKVEVNIN
jgi:hypothetical protein